MRTAILLFFTAILSACASVDDSKKTITLDSATRQYERAIRWGEYEAAVSLRVKISYYNEYTMKEITFIDYQSWKYDPDRKSWYITSPMPAFK